MKKKLVAAAGVLAIVTSSMAVGAYGATNLEAIKAYLNKGITFKVDGDTWEAKDQSGKKIYPISYNNTTYLPVRAIGEALDVEIGWDQATKTVSVNSGYLGLPDAGLVFENGELTGKAGDYSLAVDVGNDSGRDYKKVGITAYFYSGDDEIGIASGVIENIGDGEMKLANLKTSDDIADYDDVVIYVDYAY
ncbi:stalk domain-containing protein [Paenibacillus sp. GCM10023252]|uniref:stalk domain-containing protein n=1 Tax=Paenibacillus sp. GCM10023252 TaxID=3252649 RepID=UPI00360B0EED